jgi:hypothetical protein
VLCRRRYIVLHCLLVLLVQSALLIIDSIDSLYKIPLY